MHTDIQTEPTKHGRDNFSLTINGEIIYTEDPAPSVRQLLNQVNYAPADECILIESLAQGTRATTLDEAVELRKQHIRVFWAFKADRIYRFTVDGRGFDWGAAKITEPTLRLLTHLKDDEVLVLQRVTQPDQELDSEDVVDLSTADTEHLRVEKFLIEVFFKDLPYQIPRGLYSTEKLKGGFPIEPGYLLNLKTPDGELVTLKSDQTIRVKAGMRFYSQVPGGGSS
jgi:hypothetical protein